jgi:hypothetical protein
MMSDTPTPPIVPSVIFTSDHDMLVRIDTKLEIFIATLKDMDQRLRGLEKNLSEDDVKRWKIVCDEWADFKVERAVEQRGRARWWALFTTLSSLVSTALVVALKLFGILR